MKNEQVTEIIQPLFICDKCDATFVHKRNMLRHYRIKHTAETLQRHYECDICNFKFTRKDIMQKHILRKHVDQEKETFICAECLSVFDTKSSLRKHIYISHIPKAKGSLGCPHCKKNFSTYRTLKRHVANIHFKTDCLICAYCSEKFARKDNLARHIRLKHLILDGSTEGYECSQCREKFAQKHLLRDHKRYRHYVAKEEKRKSKASNLKCLECQQSFNWKRALNYHYEQEHGITLSVENLQFESLELFEEWRKSMQMKTVTQFVLRNSWKTENFETKQYACHRTGTYYDKRETRLRRLKTTGYKKLGGHCPAEIIVKSSRADGHCVVTFQQTHVGHAINDKAELDHIFLTDAEKLLITAMLEDGETMNEILEKKQSSFILPEQDNSRLSLLSRSDLHNLVSRLTVKSRCSKAGVDDLDTLVEQSSKAILYLKDQEQKDTTFLTLKEDDFGMVLMSRRQEEYLRQYGDKMVAFDGIKETSSFNFYMHTMLVVDLNGEAIPVAFMVSNRSDQDVVDIFMKKIRDRVGTVKTKVVLTDMQDVYYKSWLKIMTEPEHYFYASWHVCDSWNKELRKIVSRKKKSDLREKLYSLAYELDHAVFEEKLDSFLSMRDDNDKFMTFFRKHFSENSERWAYCYRNIAGINTNMHYDIFLKIFRRGVAGGKKQSLQEGLSYVLEYMVVEEQNEGITRLGTMIPQRIAALRRRHKSTEQYLQEKLLAVVQEGTSWQVGFPKDSEDMVQEMYIVTKVEPKECSLYENSICQLLCTLCDVCFHEYRCSCQDSVVFNNMCEHIHALGMYLKHLSGITPERIEDEVPTEDEALNDPMDIPYEEYEEDTIILNNVDSIPADETEETIDAKIIQIEENVEKIKEEAERIDVDEESTIDENPQTAVEPGGKNRVVEMQQRLMRQIENVLLMAETEDQLDMIRSRCIDPILSSIKNKITNKR